MKKFSLLTLVFCTLLFSCSNEKSTIETEVDQLNSHEEFSDVYSQLEGLVISETADDMNSLFTLYLGHLDLISEKRNLDSKDLPTFIADYKPLTFDQLYQKLNVSDHYSLEMMTELKAIYTKLKSIKSVDQKLDLINDKIEKLASNDNTELLAYILERYSTLLEVEHKGSQKATPRDCFNDCKYTNIWYGAYYSSYYSYLSGCPHCYSAAESYALDCAWLACQNHCR